jgi:hypothetical protein
MAFTAPNIIASGTTFAQFQAGGASGHLELLITANATASAAPTSAPTLAASSTGNTLAANTYYVVITESDGTGETTASPASASQVVTSGQKLTVTFPSLKTGNTSRNVYLGLASGGPFSLYATGITTATFDCTVAAPTNSFAVAPPTVNTTGFAYTDANGNGHNKVYQLIRAAKDGNLEDAFSFLRTTVADFNRGDPVAWGGAIMSIRHAATTFSLLATLCNEIGTLVDANAGTLGTTTNPIGNVKTRRTWP